MLRKRLFSNFGLTLLIFLSTVLRFWGLGYSHFYGDETKTLYIDKTVPAVVFLLDQRKGPVQFLAAWFMEKITGGYNEFWIRLPFTVAGVLAVLAFYFLVAEMFNKKTALFAAFVYSLSGFSIAFSRTAQYQSFVTLFGLLGLLYLIKYFKSLDVLQSPSLLIISAIYYSLAFLSHYDGIFYLVPAVVFFRKFLNRRIFVELLVLFLFPILFFVGIFYLPYITQGYFNMNTIGYLSRRLVGSQDFTPNNSLYTILVYNPFWGFVLTLFAGLIFLLLNFFKGFNFKLLLVWFIVPFILFQFVFKNPGTHIYNYLMPIYIAVGLFVTYFKGFPGKIIQTIFIFMLILTFTIQSAIFIPYLKINYPWNNSKLFGVYPLKSANKSWHIFLYGFPYNRGWPEIAKILAKENQVKGGRVRGFYTNDNLVMAQYYVPKYPITAAASNFYPQYYVDVINNQEIKVTSQQFLNKYSLFDEIKVENKVVSKVYKLIQP